ncbi:MAG: primosomal protein N' [Clostridia bacterium]|nr:primosomal protein N' [Clostridia bacterium]
MKYVNVVIDNKNRAVDRFFTYATTEDLSLGQKVKVPFAGSKLRTGYVVETDVTPKIEVEKIKEVKEALPISLNREMVDTCLWMKARYGIRYLDAFSCFFPKGKTPITDEKKNPLNPYVKDEPFDFTLTDEQEKAVSEICESLDKGEQQTFLIDGVTSSGKTLVYIKACEKALSMGKTAIVLVPEIGLTGQTVERFIARFGKDNVALLHSKLTTKERYDQWEKLRSGKAKICIGARIGVFAPVENIGVIILDEEHEATYKSDQNPKYDALDIAYKRTMAYKGVLILGSATPSVASYQRVKDGIYRYIKLTKRYNNTPLPDIDVVNMASELKAGNSSMLSRKLRKRMDDCLKEDKQVILFLNRRGYSNYLSCRGCGNTVKCPKCGITLTYHKQEDKLTCHYCGKKYELEPSCSICGSKYMKHSGIGTEQVEEYIRDEYPQYTVDRLDIDSGKSRHEIEDILSRFKNGKTNILVGTQLVAKGLDFTNVGLVGIISADNSLNIPDYRASERTFQLITQVAGRSGRGAEKGSVIVQTYEPEAYPIKYASNYDYQGFFNKEISIRKALDYPPFVDLVAVSFTNEDRKIAYEDGDRFSKYIKKYTRRILGIKEAINFSGERFVVLMKCSKEERNKLIYMIGQFESKSSVIIDVNPYGMI